MRRIVGDGQAFEHPAVGNAVKNGIDRPHFVCREGPSQRLTLAYWNFLPLAAPDLQFGLLI